MPVDDLDEVLQRSPGRSADFPTALEVGHRSPSDQMPGEMAIATIRGGTIDHSTGSS